MNKYCYSFNKEDYNEGRDTIKETLEEAKRETRVDSKLYETKEEPLVWIAETIYPQPLIDLDNVLEQLQDQAYDMGSDYAEDYLGDVSNEDLKELEEKLNAVFLEWQNKHNYQPHFFSWKNEKLYDLANGQLLEVHNE